MTDYRAVLVGDNRLFRDGIRQMLEKSCISVIGEGRDIAELAETASGEDYPDLVIFHLASDHSPEASLGLVRALREHFAEAKIVVLVDAGAKSVLPNFVRADVSAILLTDISSEMLERSLALVLSEHRLFPADVLSPVTGGMMSGSADLVRSETGPDASGLAETLAVDSDLSPSLSKREYQVVQCLAVGLSNKIIARELNITEGTVKVHVKGLLRKIRASNRTQLAIWALRHRRMSGDAVPDTGPDARHAA
jgi:two-component system, NarL family, nitrate/nitrite response regulator NarL